MFCSYWCLQNIWSSMESSETFIRKINNWFHWKPRSSDYEEIKLQVSRCLREGVGDPYLSAPLWGLIQPAFAGEEQHNSLLLPERDKPPGMLTCSPFQEAADLNTLQGHLTKLWKYVPPTLERLLETPALRGCGWHFQPLLTTFSPIQVLDLLDIWTFRKSRQNSF